MKLIKQNDALQAHPEFLNEHIDDHDKAVYAKGWNDCNKEYYNAITELPVASMACTDLSVRLRRAFEADELTNHRLLLDAADAIEELLDAVPHWVSVEYELPSRYETVLLNIQTCKDSYVTIGDYEPNELRFRDFADRNNQVYCGDIVTHWMPLPKAPEPPKEVE